MTIEELQAENARLKEEAERYRLASIRVDVDELHAQFNRALFDKTVAENARLKAEVERLKAEPDALTAYLYADTLRRDDIKTLKAHIERLTKAGDAMAESWIDGLRAINWEAEDVKELRDWNAAKEGKQP